MNVVARRVLHLDDPPGATVTVGPWSYQDWQAVTRMVVDVDANVDALVDLFVAHIEDHPWACAASELDVVTLGPIIRAWKDQVTVPPALRGLRH